MKSVQWIISFIGVFIFLADIAFAQPVMGSRGIALGSATTAIYDYEWGLFSNPATIDTETATIGFYGFRYYGFPEITDIAALTSVPLEFGVASFGLSRFGDDLFSETQVKTSLKVDVQGVSIAASISYNHISQGGNYGSGGAFGIDLGVFSNLSEKFSLGAKIQNANRPSYNFDSYDEELPQNLSVGVSYQLEKSAILVFDVLKDVRFPVSFRGGVEIEVIDKLVGRIGITTEPVTYSFGIGYCITKFDVNFGVQRHEILGISPGLDLIVRI